MRKIGGFFKKMVTSYMSAVAKAYNDKFYMYGCKF